MLVVLDLFIELFSGILAGAFIILFFLFVLFIAWLVFYYIGMWKFYKKAGQEGWKCLIPFYNSYVMTVDMAGLKWYWFAITLGGIILGSIPFIGFLFLIVSVFAYVNIYYNLSKRLNKSTDWIVLTTLFGFVTLPLLGYMNNTTWNQAAPVDSDGLLTTMLNKNNNNSNNNNNNQQSAPQNTQQSAPQNIQQSVPQNLQQSVPQNVQQSVLQNDVNNTQQK